MASCWPSRQWETPNEQDRSVSVLRGTRSLGEEATKHDGEGRGVEEEEEEPETSY